MSKSHSPSRYSRGMDDAMMYDAAFAQDISHKMRVPKRIKATGDVSDEDMTMGSRMPWDHRDKFDMNVPDRILLAGQDQHIGTKAPPREITLENSVLPPDPGLVRVNTPPRIITLDHHYFPSAAENHQYGGWQQTPPSANGFDSSYYSYAGQQNSQKTTPSPEDNGICISPPNRTSGDTLRSALTQNDNRRHIRESTPLSSDALLNSTGAVEGLSVSEEMMHLRRQMARLNRRLMAVEMESVRRQQRDRLFAAAGLAYIVLKVLAWLNRN